MAEGNLLTKFLVWRIKHISNNNFVYILSAIIGIVAGLAAVVLKYSVHLVTELQFEHIFPLLGKWFYLIAPMSGILITVLLARKVFKERIGHGISTVLYGISKGSSLLKKRMMGSRVFLSIITVGFGGSVGLEAPIVTTGSAIGSNIGRQMHLNYKKRTLLIGCGSSAAIAAIFNSPIAGVIFSIEVILAEVSISKFIPLLIASVAGSIVSTSILGSEYLFKLEKVDAFTGPDVIYYIALGAFCGFLAVHFTRMTYLVEASIGRFKQNVPRTIIGGLLLGCLVLIFPPLFGEGYGTINLLLNNDVEHILDKSLFSEEVRINFIYAFIIAMVLIKVVASALTIGLGGSGGIFAPSLFVGSLAGFIFASIVNSLGISRLSILNFTLVGMCGLMSGIMHAPLTAIFLIAEITGGYELIVPLMTVSAISYLFKTYFEPYSIYTKKLIEKGDLITNNKDKEVLSLIDLSKLIEKNFEKLNPNDNLNAVIEAVKVSSRNIFPVVDEQGYLCGILRLDDVRRIIFDHEIHDQIYIKTVMQNPRAVIRINDDMQTVMSKFETSATWNLAVVDENDIYLGFISKSNIFNSYRNRIIKQQKD